MRVIIAGGGGADASRKCDEVFAGWLGQHGRLLYLPVAMQGIERTYHESLAWLESVFVPFGISNITMCTEMDQCLNRDLGFYHGVYIGGGNTFRLLHLMRSTGFDRALLHFARTGGAVYGGSAGAIILGREIGTSAHLDANRVGLTNLEGLNLLLGYSIWCHYQPEDDDRIAAYLQRTNYPILALSESSGICLHADQLRTCGYETVRVYRGGGVQFIRPGDEIPLPLA